MDCNPNGLGNGKYLPARGHRNASAEASLDAAWSPQSRATMPNRSCFLQSCFYVSTVLPNPEAGRGGGVSMGVAPAPSCSHQPGTWGTTWPLHRAAQMSWCTIPSVLRWNYTGTCFSSCEKAAELLLAWKAIYKDVYHVLAMAGATSVSSHPQHS